MKVRVSAFSLSIDGFVAGSDQSLADPLGKGGEALHEWMFHTPTFRAMFGEEGGDDGIDERFAARSMANVGAWILGRNMFGPVRGPWPDDAWKGWWGEEPPYHVPVFVLTNHPRDPIAMKGGTVFHFVTDGAEAALDRAREAAGGKDVRIGGGAATVRQYLEARAIDELHVAVAPILLGRGEPLWQGLDLAALGYKVTDSVVGEKATHLIIERQGETAQ